MAELDRELTRGERAVAGVDRLNDLASPLRELARAAVEMRRRVRARPHRVRRDADHNSGRAGGDDEAPVI